MGALCVKILEPKIGIIISIIIIIIIITITIIIIITAGWSL
jgi:hypothetical protein